MKLNFFEQKKKRQSRQAKQQKTPMSLLPLNKLRSKVRLKALGQRWQRPCQRHSCEEDCAGALERLSDSLLVSYAEYQIQFYTEKLGAAALTLLHFFNMGKCRG